MTDAIYPPSARIIADYLRAKDAQLPRLYPHIFTADARFEATFVKPGPFPKSAPAEGVEAIAETFRSMNRRCENIITVVPAETIRKDEDGILYSHWLVAMTVRDGGGGFVGWGSYRWTLDEDGRRATELSVLFEGHALMDPAGAGPILDRLIALPHPFCAWKDLLLFAEETPALVELREWLAVVERSPRTLGQQAF